MTGSSGIEALVEVIGGAMRLHGEAFRDVQRSGPAGVTGIWIALLAGFSQAIGQAFVLFVNRVRPLRFSISLVLEAILFAVGFLAWAISTWLITWLVFHRTVSPVVVVRALGVAHAPKLLAFLGAMPYLGVPWLSLLSIWTALAFVVGLMAVTGLPPWQVFICLVGGWWLTHSLLRNAAQPLHQLGPWLLDRGAGVPLARDGRSLKELLESGDTAARGAPSGSAGGSKGPWGG